MLKNTIFFLFKLPIWGASVTNDFTHIFKRTLEQNFVHVIFSEWKCSTLFFGSFHLKKNSYRSSNIFGWIFRRLYFVNFFYIILHFSHYFLTSLIYFSDFLSNCFQMCFFNFSFIISIYFLSQKIIH